MPRRSLLERDATEAGEAREQPALSTHAETSGLVTNALQACFEGDTSAFMVQQWCLHAILDPRDHPELGQIASLAAAGSQPGNAMRDLIAYVEDTNTNHLPQPTSVAAPLMDTKTGSVVEGHLDVFDPSLLLQGLGASDEFDHIMRTDLVETFWAGVKIRRP